jgi:hypothetical protein
MKSPISKCSCAISDRSAGRTNPGEIAKYFDQIGETIALTKGPTGEFGVNSGDILHKSLSDQISPLYFQEKHPDNSRFQGLNRTFQGKKEGCKKLGNLSVQN